MKNSVLYLILLLLLLPLTYSCEKVIEVDLNEAEQQVVIEALVLNNQGQSFVKLSKTASYYQTNDFESISNAEVIIKDGNGNSFSFTEESEGYYTNDAFTGEVEQTYSININVDGARMSSSSTMPKLIPIDSLTFEIEQARFGLNETIRVKCHYTDPVDEENFYRFRFYHNQQQVSGFRVKSDRRDDGNATYYLINQEDFEIGDTIQVEMYSIDEANYKYFEVLGESGGGPGSSAAPGNPVSNIEGNAIGVFGAYSVSEGFIELK